MAKANAIDESLVEKRLLTANSSQESIQSLSLWALNHKTQHEKIVAVWFKVLKTAKLELRVALFYVCNEIVQTCRRKHAVVFKDAFKEVLKDAALLVRDNSIRQNIERIFKIWGERGIYDGEFVEELLAILYNTKVKSSLSSKLLADFKASNLLKLIAYVSNMEEDVEDKRISLPERIWDLTDIDDIKQQLKDRHQGKEYVQELDEMRLVLQQYVNSLQDEMNQRKSLILMLEQSELYYDAQKGECNIVATAYKNFGTRIFGIRKKLIETQKILPELPSEMLEGADSSRLIDSNTDGKKLYASVDDDDISLSSSSVHSHLSGSETDPPVSAPNPEILIPPPSTTYLPKFGSLTSGSLEGPIQYNIVGDATPVRDEDGGATPVQDEDPADAFLDPLQFLNHTLNISTDGQWAEYSQSSRPPTDTVMYDPYHVSTDYITSYVVDDPTVTLEPYNPEGPPIYEQILYSTSFSDPPPVFHQSSSPTYHVTNVTEVYPSVLPPPILKSYPADAGGSYQSSAVIYQGDIASKDHHVGEGFLLKTDGFSSPSVERFPLVPADGHYPAFQAEPRQDSIVYRFQAPFTQAASAPPDFSHPPPQMMAVPQMRPMNEPPQVVYGEPIASNMYRLPSPVTASSIINPPPGVIVLGPSPSTQPNYGRNDSLPFVLVSTSANQWETRAPPGFQHVNVFPRPGENDFDRNRFSHESMGDSFTRTDDQRSHRNSTNSFAPRSNLTNLTLVETTHVNDRLDCFAGPTVSQNNRFPIPHFAGPSSSDRNLVHANSEAGNKDNILKNLKALRHESDFHKQTFPANSVMTLSNNQDVEDDGEEMYFDDGNDVDASEDDPVDSSRIPSLGSSSRTSPGNGMDFRGSSMFRSRFFRPPRRGQSNRGLQNMTRSFTNNFRGVQRQRRPNNQNQRFSFY